MVEAPVSFAERWWNERPVNMDLISSLPKQNHEISLEEFENLRTKAVEDSLHLRSKLPRPENFIVLRLEPQSALQASTVGADFSLTVPGPAVYSRFSFAPVFPVPPHPYKMRLYSGKHHPSRFNTRSSAPWMGRC